MRPMFSRRKRRGSLRLMLPVLMVVSWLRAAGVRAAPESSSRPGGVPELHGVVLRVSNGRCVLSVGADAGVKKGRLFWVENSQRPDCLRVMEVSVGRCVAAAFTSEAQSRVTVGDIVTSSEPSLAGSAEEDGLSPVGAVSARVEHRKGEAKQGARRTVIVRVRGNTVWLSGGGDEGIYRGMLGEVRGAGEPPVRLLVTASNQTSAVARVVEASAAGRVIVGQEVVAARLSAEERLGLIRTVNKEVATERAGRGFRPGAGTQGSTGLINTPTAATVADGTVKVGYLQTQGYNPLTRGVGKLEVSYLTIGFLPRLEVTGRLTQRALTPTSPRLDKLDRSANVKLQLVPEGGHSPALAFGIDDVAGNKLNRAMYVVGSKQSGRTRVHLGYGRDRLAGVFLGVDEKVTATLTAMAEWDTDDVNSGLRFQLSDRVGVDAYLLGMDTLRLGVSYASFLGRRDEAEYVSTGNEVHALAGETMDWPAAAEAIQAALTAGDFEDVEVRVRNSHDRRFPGTTVVVAYTDRTRPRTPLAGLASALRLVAVHCPANGRNLQVVVKSRDVPVLYFTTRLDDYLKFVNFALSPEMYRARVSVSVTDPLGQGNRQKRLAELTSVAGLGTSSYFRPDVSITPVFHYDLGHAADIVRTQMSLTADVDTQVARGTVLELQLARTLWTEFHRVGRREDLHFRRADLRHTRRLNDRTFAQAALGYLKEGTYGLSGEFLQIRDHGRASLGIQAQALGSTFTHWSHRSALTDIRYRLPDLDLTASLKYGRFLGGDRGVELALDRRLGHHRMGLIGANTDYGSYGGVRLTFPMGPTRYRSPRRQRVRVHAGDRFAWNYQSNADNDRGLKLVTGRELEQTLMQDERLYPPFVLRHIERLRNTAGENP